MNNYDYNNDTNKYLGRKYFINNVIESLNSKIYCIYRKN